jgi:transcription elongation factor GreB
MSRAFVKEDGHDLAPLPDLPVSPHPNYVTPRGLAGLAARLRARQADLAALRARPDRLDKLPEAAAERDIRYLEARLRARFRSTPQPSP